MKIGLTGGIGCGKSTVVQLFAEAGWRTVETDAVVRDCLADDSEVHVALRERWGESVFDADGAVDRKAIAGRVFTDSGELAWLEALLHPIVRRAWESAIAEEPEAHWLVEIPLLFEKRLETEFDLIVCVTSPSEIVEHRMVHRGYSGEEIKQRRLRQMPLEEKARRANCVISNAGNLEFLKQQTKRLIAQTQTY
ncbi:MULTISPECIES: dephospho-CoA kinase [unclassified Lentimonas]|uniref:dephospho-CoA kinase n=1 Tax=unclassified Lentimonas TaxID=2630993 RepID=UPI001389C247|nr:MULTISPECIES: dephospho-CoA kinase [unclassified Lentimonas]